MAQSKKLSAIESVVNQVTGFLLSVLIFQYIIGPYMLGIQPDWVDNMNITVVFTIVSMVRGYVVRRIFNKLGG